jgi:AraC-like DNA-binding protein
VRVPGENEKGAAAESVVIRTADVPPRERLDLWHHVSCETLVPLRMSTEFAADYLGVMAHYALGAGQLVDMTACPLLVERTPRLISASDPGLYKVELQLRGTSVLTQGDHQTLLGPGQVAVVDTGRPYRMAAGHPHLARSATAGDTGSLPHLVTLMLPKALLPLPGEAVAEVTATELAERIPTGGLVAATLAQLARSAAAGDRATASRLVPVVSDLLAVGLAGLHDRTAALNPEYRRRALLARIETFIEAHLSDPGLSADTIAAAHHMSRRSLYALFSECAATTVAAHIRTRRLERCRRDLADPAHRHRSVAAIAAAWGFPSLAHFTRLFRTTYGLPPAAYRGTAPTDR